MVAFDHLRLRLSDFDWAYKILPIFKKVISNDKEVEDADKDQDGEAGENPGKSGKKAKK